MKYKIDFVFDNVFSTFILPNATMPELGVINYLSSIHSTKAQNATVFEMVIPMMDMFDGQFGNFPNSCTGFFYQAAVYNKILTSTENAIYFSARGTNAFIYPIKPNPTLTNFVGINSGKGNRVHGEYFWKYISKQTMHYIFQNRVKIFFDYSMEPYVDFNTYKDIHESIGYSNLPKDSIIMCINSFNAKELYESWFTESERKLNIINLPFCLDHSSWYYDWNLTRNNKVCMDETAFFNTKQNVRDNHFLMKMKNNRPHRLALLFKLLSVGNILEKADWSFYAINSSYNEQWIEHVATEYDLHPMDMDKIKNLYDTEPHKLQSEQNQKPHDINAWTDMDFEQYINSYFEVCFETYIDGEYKSLTEKIFKPIINFQPFIFVAFPGALQLLKNLGFKTFEGFIDESYDLETNVKIRMNKISQEIIRLSSLSKEEIHNWYWKMEDILLHNHRTLRNYNNIKLYGEDLIKELSNFCLGKEIKWVI
jgi:hypothetical protein